MEDRRKTDRRDPAARDALSPETLALLRLCGASVRSADDPEAVRTGASTDRRRRPAAGSVSKRAPEAASR